MLLFSISRPVVKIIFGGAPVFGVFCFMALEKYLSFESAKNSETNLQDFSKSALKNFISHYEIPFAEVSENFGSITKEGAIELIQTYAETLTENRDGERVQTKKEVVATSAKKVEPKVAPIENIAEAKTPELPKQNKNYAKAGAKAGCEKAQFSFGYALGFVGGLVATPYYLLKG
jgi:hypothetical protein